MAWRFPEHTPVSSGVTDNEDMNRGMLPTAEELGGRLNEHNWKDNAIQDRSDLDISAAFHWHQSSQAVVLRSSTNAFLVRPIAEWTSVTGCSLSITCPACLLWIHVSCQLQSPSAVANNPGPQIAIRVDGNVVTETITGGVEHENDDNAAILYGEIPLACQVLQNVGEGNHTVDLVVRTIRAGTPSNFYTIEIGSREIIALEMRR